LLFISDVHLRTKKWKKLSWSIPSTGCLIESYCI
jgi:hypothetical protein